LGEIVRGAHHCCRYLSVVAWLVSVNIVIIVAVTEHTRLLPVANLAMIVAGCATLVAFLGRPIAPVEEAYRMGYEAGRADGRRVGMPTLVRLPVNEVR
jgi:hypothetical protein